MKSKIELITAIIYLVIALTELVTKIIEKL